MPHEDYNIEVYNNSLGVIPEENTQLDVTDPLNQELNSYRPQNFEYFREKSPKKLLYTI